MTKAMTFANFCHSTIDLVSTIIHPSLCVAPTSGDKYFPNPYSTIISIFPSSTFYFYTLWIIARNLWAHSFSTSPCVWMCLNVPHCPGVTGRCRPPSYPAPPGTGTQTGRRRSSFFPSVRRGNSTTLRTISSPWTTKKTSNLKNAHVVLTK